MTIPPSRAEHRMTSPHRVVAVCMTNSCSNSGIPSPWGSRQRSMRSPLQKPETLGQIPVISIHSNSRDRQDSVLGFLWLPSECSVLTLAMDLINRYIAINARSEEHTSELQSRPHL